MTADDLKETEQNLTRHSGRGRQSPLTVGELASNDPFIFRANGCGKMRFRSPDETQGITCAFDSFTTYMLK